MKVQAQAWISDEDSTGDYWADGVKCAVEVQLTDADEVRIGVIFDHEETDVATLYVSRDTADKLARFLAAAAVDTLPVPIPDTATV